MNTQTNLPATVDLPVVKQDAVEPLLAKAIEHGVPVETMERLLAMRRELRAEAAKEAFDRAMTAFQAQCPPIKKTKEVRNKNSSTVRYRYAPLEVIIAQVKELLEQNGFSYNVDVVVEPQWVISTCKAKHVAGHSETSTFKVPIDKDAYMNEAQKFASAQTFARRYAFCNAFGIMTADEDDDSHASGPNAPESDFDSARPSAPTQPGKTPQRPTPAPAKPAPEPKQATEKTRAWFVDEILKRVDRDIAIQWFIDKDWIKFGKGLMELPLDKVPTNRADAEAIIELIQADPNAVPKGSDFAPSTPETSSEWFWGVVCPIPNKGQKRDAYLQAPDTIGSLYARMKDGDEKAQRRLWGFANDWEPSGWQGSPPREEDVEFRKALDAFLEWEKEQGEGEVTP